MFVPEKFREESYYDGPLPIGEDQTISQPYIVALMSSALGLTTGEKVLEIGTGSGYQAAVLAEMGMQYFDSHVDTLVGNLKAKRDAIVSALRQHLQRRLCDRRPGHPHAHPGPRLHLHRLERLAVII